MAKDTVKTGQDFKGYEQEIASRTDSSKSARAKTSFVKSLLAGLLYGLAGLLMARAVLFDQCAPFGISYLAAGVGKNERGSFYSLAGVFLGSLSIGGSISLHYAGAAVLVFGLRYFLFDIKRLGTRHFFSPLLAGLVGGGTSFIFVFLQGFLIYDMIFWATEILLCSAGAYFLRIAIPAVKQVAFGNRPSHQELYSILIALAVMLLGLTGLSLGGFKPAAFIGTLCILSIAGHRGAAPGSLAGIAVGLVLSIGTRKLSFLPGACAFGGLLAGVFAETGRFGTAAAYILSSSVIILYFGGPYQVLSSLTYTALAAALYMIIPSRVYYKLGVLSSASVDDSRHAERMREFLKGKIQEIAGIYREISHNLSALSKKYHGKNTGEISDVFFQASNRVCRRCGMRQFCWVQDFNGTMNVMNDLAPVLRKKGSAKREDMASPFKDRCMHIVELVSEINRAYEDFLTRERARGRSQESRQLLSNEYELLASVMDNLTFQLGQNLRFDCEAEDRIMRCLRGKGIKVKDVVCCYDGQGRVEVTVAFEDERPAIDSNELAQEISCLLGRAVKDPIFALKDGDTVACLSEKERFDVCYGVSSRAKYGELTNGDSTAFFKSGGKAVLLISDGMGSGNLAFAGSSLATQMIQHLLNAGIDRDTALRLLNHALIIKSGGEYFATLDIVDIDLFSGEALFIKAGAAPTYICREGEIFRVQSVSLPAGILNETSYEEVKCTVRDKDIIIMLSDGVLPCDSNDKWLKDLLLGAVTKNPQTMAERILSVASRNESSRNDDMTVICAFVGKNE